MCSLFRPPGGRRVAGSWRLLTELSTVVLDLSGVTFLGVAGLELISAAHAYAPYRNQELIVIGGPTAVERALRAGRLDGSAPTAEGTHALRHRK